jgi:integrase
VAWIRQLPSGRWAATVHTPAGRRTETDRLKTVVKAWADEQESQVRRGDWIDPRQAETTVGAWWERCRDSRRLERASRKRDESHWRNHVAPKWAKVELGSIMKPDVSTWVVAMERKGVGAATIEGAVGLLRALLEQAVDARMLRVNPARGVSKPRRAAHVDRVLTADEERALLDAMERHHPGYPAARLMCEVMLDTAVRWEEVAALDRDHVDMRRRILHIGPVMERDGTIREYPKSPAGIRPVPVGDELWPRLREHALSIKPGGLVFTAPRGGPLLYTTWHRRTWLPALRGVPAQGARRGRAAAVAVPGAGLDDPQPTPHDLRHSAATHMAENGVPPHELKELLGHADLAATQRYLHAGEGRFERARQARARSRRTSTS